MEPDLGLVLVVSGQTCATSLEEDLVSFKYSSSVNLK